MPAFTFSGDPASRETLERFQADIQMFATGNTNPDPGSYMKTYTCGEITKQGKQLDQNQLFPLL